MTRLRNALERTTEFFGLVILLGGLLVGADMFLRRRAKFTGRAKSARRIRRSLHVGAAA